MENEKKGNNSLKSGSEYKEFRKKKGNRSYGNVGHL